MSVFYESLEIQKDPSQCQGIACQFLPSYVGTITFQTVPFFRGQRKASCCLETPLDSIPPEKGISRLVLPTQLILKEAVVFFSQASMENTSISQVLDQ